MSKLLSMVGVADVCFCIVFPNVLQNLILAKPNVVVTIGECRFANMYFMEDIWSKAFLSIIRTCQKHIKARLDVFDDKFHEYEKVQQLKAQFNKKDIEKLIHIDRASLAGEFISSLSPYLTNTQFLEKQTSNVKALKLSTDDAFYYCRKSDDLIKRFLHALFGLSTEKPADFIQAGEIIATLYPLHRVNLKLDNLLFRLGKIYCNNRNIPTDSVYFTTQSGLIVIIKYLMDRYGVKFNRAEHQDQTNTKTDTQKELEKQREKRNQQIYDTLETLLLVYSKRTIQTAPGGDIQKAIQKAPNDHKKISDVVNTAANVIYERASFMKTLSTLSEKPEHKPGIGTKNIQDVKKATFELAARLLSENYQQLMSIMDAQSFKTDRRMSQGQLSHDDLRHRLLIICLNRWVELYQANLITNITGQTQKSFKFFCWYMSIFNDEEIQASLKFFAERDEPDTAAGQYFGMFFEERALRDELNSRDLSRKDFYRLWFFRSLNKPTKAFLESEVEDIHWEDLLEFMNYGAIKDNELLAKTRSLYMDKLKELANLNLLLGTLESIKSAYKKHIQESMQTDFEASALISCIPDSTYMGIEDMSEGKIDVVSSYKQTISKKGYKNFLRLLSDERLILKESLESEEVNAKGEQLIKWGYTDVNEHGNRVFIGWAR